MVKVYTILIILFFACSAVAYSQNTLWVVPSDLETKTNPLEIQPKNIALGRNIFKRSCVACHGEKADGKGLILSTSLIDENFQKQTDGAIFYKINTGRDKMPPFSAMLKEEETWSVINYLRVLVDPSAIPPPKDAVLEISTGKEIKSVTATVLSADSTRMPLNEVDVHFYIKRDFGLMPFGETANYTGTDGKVKVVFPEKIIGDSLGNVELVVKIENNFLYNNAESSVVMNWGTTLVTHDDEFNHRSLWGSRDKSPVWLLLLANGIIAVVWTIILYVVYNLFRIKKAGKIFIK